MADPCTDMLPYVCDDYPPGAYVGREDVYVVFRRDGGPLAACGSESKALQVARRLQRMDEQVAVLVHRLPIDSPPCYDVL